MRTYIQLLLYISVLILAIFYQFLTNRIVISYKLSCSSIHLDLIYFNVSYWKKKWYASKESIDWMRSFIRDRVWTLASWLIRISPWHKLKGLASWKRGYVTNEVSTFQSCQLLDTLFIDYCYNYLSPEGFTSVVTEW